MIVATEGKAANSKPISINVRQRPRNQFSAYAAARCVSDGRTGRVILDLLEEDSLGGGGAGVMSAEAFRAAKAMTLGNLVLPRGGSPWQIPVTRLGNPAGRGKCHTTYMEGYLGAAFSTHQIADDQTVEFAMPWSHDCEL